MTTLLRSLVTRGLSRFRRQRAARTERARLRAQVEALEPLCLLAPVTLGPFAIAFEETLIEGITRTGTVPQFDPELGELQEVRIRAGTSLSGRFAIENLSSTDQQIIIARIQGGTALTGPGLATFAPGSFVDATPSINLSTQPALFPEPPLFCGPEALRVGVTPRPDFLPPEVVIDDCPPGSGTQIIDQPLGGSNSFSIMLTSSTDLAAFLGTGNVTYAFDSQGQTEIDGDTGNLLTLSLLSSAAEVQVEYVYEPPPIEPNCIEADVNIRGVHHQPTVIVMALTGNVDPVAAADLVNYELVQMRADGQGVLRTIPLQSVVYNAAANTATLTPVVPLLPLGVEFRLTVSQRLAGPGEEDGFRNLEDPDAPCGDFATLFRRGTHLHFADSDGDGVTMGVSHGGLLEMYRAPTGQIRQVKIRSVLPAPKSLQPPHSFFRGSVTRRGPAGDGRVTIGELVGTSQVRNQLPRPPFQVIREIPEAPAPAAQPGSLYANLSLFRNRSLYVRQPS